jgi:hypothetical protein
MVSWVSLGAGCSTVCEEVADEAEASGCAVGTQDGSEEPEPVECTGDLEKRAQCLLDNTDNVCSITEAEAAKVAECISK